jgi:hypothetical protein
MKLIKQLMFALIIGQYMLSATGCSALGFGIGALSDSNKIHKLEIPSEELTLIPKNSRIQIFLKNGQQQEGEFLMHMEQKVGEEYVKSIVWYEKGSNRQVSTPVADIERIAAKQQRNGKWIGLGVGGVIDAIMVVGAINAAGNSLDGLDFGF